MGCGNLKEKIEDELMRAKFERIQVQMERINQLKLLEELTGQKIKISKIPDYLSPINNNNKIENEKDNTSITNRKSLKKSKSQILRIKKNEENIAKSNKRLTLKKSKK